LSSLVNPKSTICKSIPS